MNLKTITGLRPASYRQPYEVNRLADPDAIDRQLVRCTRVHHNLTGQDRDPRARARRPLGVSDQELRAGHIDGTGLLLGMVE